MTYSEKLTDPRWQKRRLDILSLHKFTCEECGDKERTLHVHHCYYISGKSPWDYPDDALKSLCAYCHKERATAERLLLASVVGATTGELMNLSLSILEILQVKDGFEGIITCLDEHEKEAKMDFQIQIADDYAAARGYLT